MFLGCSVVLFIFLFVYLVSYCYLDISWTTWTILIKLTGNIHQPLPLTQLDSGVKGRGRPMHCGKGVHPVSKDVYSSACHDKHNCPSWDCSSSAGSSANNRLVLIVDVVIELLNKEQSCVCVVCMSVGWYISNRVCCVHECRMVYLARDYSTKRVCFGKTIRDHKLHVKNLANMEVQPAVE